MLGGVHLNQINCPLEKVLEIINGKWTILILWYLRLGILRNSELKRKMPGITQKMLSQQLRNLEKNMLIIRTVYPEVPVRVEYSLSELGMTILPILIQLNSWGHEHLSTINNT